MFAHFILLLIQILVILELTYPEQIYEMREATNQNTNDKDGHSQREDLTIFLKTARYKEI